MNVFVPIFINGLFGNSKTSFKHKWNGKVKCRFKNAMMKSDSFYCCIYQYNNNSDTRNL